MDFRISGTAVQLGVFRSASHALHAPHNPQLEKVRSHECPRADAIRLAATLYVRNSKMTSRLAITTIDCRLSDATELFRSLRDKLSPRGDVVSEAGRQRTIELFGEPLSPREVVRRICDDVRSRGLDAVLHYTSKLDRRDLTAESMRVTPEELASAAKKASPEFLAAIRQIRDNITEFQRAVLPRDASETSADETGGHLRAGRCRCVSFDGAHDCGTRDDCRCSRNCNRGASD